MSVSQIVHVLGPRFPNKESINMNLNQSLVITPATHILHTLPDTNIREVWTNLMHCDYVTNSSEHQALKLLEQYPNHAGAQRQYKRCVEGRETIIQMKNGQETKVS